LVLQSGSSLRKSERQLILIGVCFRHASLARFPWISYSKYFYPFAALMHACHSVLYSSSNVFISLLSHIIDIFIRSKMRLRWNTHWPPHHPRIHTELECPPPKAFAHNHRSPCVYSNPLRPHLFPCARILPRMTTQCLHMSV
jgi:hypothetical protein